MASFSNPIDPFGISDNTTIVLSDSDGGPRRELVEVLDESANWIADATKEIKPIEEFTANYDLLDGSSVDILLGQPFNTDYLITAINANYSNEGYPTLALTGLKPSSASKILTHSAKSVTITGGFGVVAKFGVSGTIDALSSAMSVSMSQAEALEETSGDYLDSGLVAYAFKQEITIECYATAPSVPSGGKLMSRDTRTARDGFKTYAMTFTKYL